MRKTSQLEIIVEKYTLLICLCFDIICSTSMCFIFCVYVCVCLFVCVVSREIMPAIKCNIIYTFILLDSNNNGLLFILLLPPHFPFCISCMFHAISCFCVCVCVCVCSACRKETRKRRRGVTIHGSLRVCVCMCVWVCVCV